jgi:hypothetical protein
MHRHIYVECVTTLHLTQNSATLVTFILSTGVYEVRTPATYCPLMVFVCAPAV